MEVDSLDAISDIACQSWLAGQLKTFVVWKSTLLVEVSEQVVEVNHCSSVQHEFVPVGGLTHWFEALFEIRDDLLKVPRESQNVSVLVFVEGDVSPDDSLVLGYASFLFWFHIGGDNVTRLELWDLSHSHHS